MTKEERFDWDYELSKSRVVLLTGEIGEDTVHQVCTKLTILDDKNPEYEDEDGNVYRKPIWLYINSYGGSIYDGLAVIDTMRSLRSPVFTVVRGKAMSMGAAIAALGDRRFATPHSRIMFHEAAGGTKGKINSMEEEVAECRFLNDELMTLISERIGMKTKDFSKLIYKKDVYISAEEALKINAIDEIIQPSEKTIDPKYLK